jgi:hypothetical protein
VEDFLARVFDHQGILAIVVTGILSTVAEVGYRFGRRLHAAADGVRLSQIGAVQAAVLGILGLLLGFTFSMAVDRYDSRRTLVLEEANTIRTAWLRGGLLPDAHRQAVRDLLRGYVDVRIFPKGREDPRLLAEELRRSVEMQFELWQHAESAALEAPNDMTATFVESLNDMIDAGTARIAAARNRIPFGVWLILMVVAVVGCSTIGYGAGASGVPSPLRNLLLPLLVSVVILLIVDLTNERRGIISVSPQALIDLQNAFQAGHARGADRSSIR